MDGLKNHPLEESVGFALSGIWRAVKSERNIKIELGFAFAVILAGWFFGVSKTEWLTIVLVISGVLSAEIFNSAVEGVCNLIRDKNHLGYDETKLIRDIAAGAVMLLAIGSIVLGLAIFLPYLISALASNLIV